MEWRAVSTIPINRVGKEIPEWRALYLAALFETDKNRLPVRINHAERALVQRERELFTASMAAAEKTAVNNALHALHALRMCLGLAA